MIFIFLYYTDAHKVLFSSSASKHISGGCTSFLGAAGKQELPASRSKKLSDILTVLFFPYSILWVFISENKTAPRQM